MIDSFSYSSTNAGKSWSLVDGTWEEQIPTPGYANNESWVYYEENNCNWKVEILSEDIFNYNEFEFKYKIIKVEGDKTNITLIRGIEDVYGNIVKNYDNYTQEITTQHTTSYFSPNLDEGNYLIKGEIFPNCNDFNLKNNFDYKFITILPEGISQDYTKIKINELFPNPEGYDTASMPNGEFVELYNSGSSTLDLENLSLKDNYGRDMDIFISNSNTFDTIINTNSFLVVYMNGRYGFLNNDGFEKISLYKEDYLLDEVSYSGSSEGLTWSRINDKWVLSLPTPNSQNYNNESDITISRLNVDKIYDLGNDNIAKFGQIIRIKLLVYKGDTNKESIKFYIEDEDGERVSKESKVNVEDKFMNYTFTTPIQLIPNCNQKFNDGIYNIVISGLEDTDKEKIEIEGITPSLCEVVKEVKETISTSVSSDSESVLNGEYITGSVVYEGDEQGSYAVYFFCFSLISVILYLLIKNE